MSRTFTFQSLGTFCYCIVRSWEIEKGSWMKDQRVEMAYENKDPPIPRNGLLRNQEFRQRIIKL